MAVPVAFFAVFFAYPVAAIVARGLKADGIWQFGRIGDVLAQSDVRQVLWFTTWQALASTALTLLIVQNSARGNHRRLAPRPSFSLSLRFRLKCQSR